MNITILGSGAFAKGIINILSNNKDNHIKIWTHDEDYAKKANKQGKITLKDKMYLNLDNISITSNLEEALDGSKIIFILVSSKYYGDLITELKEFNLKNKAIYIGTKGMIGIKPYFLSDYTKKSLKVSNISFFAGPNLADDLLNNSPCIITLASKKKKEYLTLKKIFPSFIKLEYISYINIVELCSILKNIYAIGAGIFYAKYPYSSTLVSYTTLASKELAKILYNKYAFEEIELYGGILGDFFLTNTMKESRNFNFGLKRCESVKDSLEYAKKNTVEGYNNLGNILNYIGRYKSYKIINTLYDIIYKNQDVKALYNLIIED